MVIVTTKVESSDVFKDLEHFGRFQIVQYILICMPLLTATMSLVNYVFVAEDINYRCKVPECDTGNSTSTVPSWWPIDTDSKCYKPIIDQEKYTSGEPCSNASFLDDVEVCQEWIYESENSIVAGLDLGCQSWIASLVGSVHNSGMIAAMLLAGWISDKIGRKPTIILCSVGGAIGVTKMFLTNYYAYLVVEFLESFFSSGLYTVCVVLLIEVGGESKRVLAGVIFSYATYVGEVVFAFFAMGLKYWKSLIIVVYAPLILFVFYAFVLRESTRWQMLRGKMEEAKDTFKSMAKMNKLKVTAKEIDEINDEELRLTFNVQIQKEKESMKEIINSREIVKRLLVTSVCFFSSSFIFCGLMVHSVFLPGNKYTNFALVSLTSFPGDVLAYFTFIKYGRRLSLQYAYFATAFFTVCQAYTPESLSWLKLTLYLLGKFAVVVTFTGIFTYSMELFPTSVRGTLVGFGNTVARIGSMLSPVTPLLTAEMATLPAILFSSTAIMAGSLLVFTPETKTMPLFDTIKQVEAYKAKTDSIK